MYGFIFLFFYFLLHHQLVRSFVFFGYYHFIFSVVVNPAANRHLFKAGAHAYFACFYGAYTAVVSVCKKFGNVAAKPCVFSA